jgi:YD repeat-containing protein
VKVLPNGATWIYEYDDNGLLTKIIDPLGGVSGTTRDHLIVQPVAESDPTGNAVGYA